MAEQTEKKDQPKSCLNVKLSEEFNDVQAKIYSGPGRPGTLYIYDKQPVGVFKFVAQDPTQTYFSDILYFNDNAFKTPSYNESFWIVDTKNLMGKGAGALIERNIKGDVFVWPVVN